MHTSCVATLGVSAWFLPHAVGTRWVAASLLLLRASARPARATAFESCPAGARPSGHMNVTCVSRQPPSRLPRRPLSRNRDPSPPRSPLSSPQSHLSPAEVRPGGPRIRLLASSHPRIRLLASWYPRIRYPPAHEHAHSRPSPCGRPAPVGGASATTTTAAVSAAAAAIPPPAAVSAATSSSSSTTTAEAEAAPSAAVSIPAVASAAAGRGSGGDGRPVLRAGGAAPIPGWRR